MSTSNLEKELKNTARTWAARLTRYAKALAPNNHIKRTIRTRNTQDGRGKYTMTITASGPDARAREYGSGIHARRKSRRSKNQLPDGRILIRPRTGKYLAFEWEVATAEPDRFNMLPDGRVALKEVKHPGVEAANGGVGYIAPAVTRLRQEAKQELSPKIRKAILADINTAFKKGRK